MSPINPASASALTPSASSAAAIADLQRRIRVLERGGASGGGGAGSVADATTVTKGKLQLAGDIGGTASLIEVKNKLDVFNITDAAYGAVGDGSLTANTGTDNTTFIQAAINAAIAAGGGIIYVPEGIFRATALTGDASNLVFMGAGHGSVIKQTEGVADNVYLISVNGATPTPANNKTGIQFINLQLRGTCDVVADAFDSAKQHVHLIRLSAVSDVLISGCLIKGFRGDGVYLQGNDGANLRHNYRIKITETTFDGINKENRNAISIIDGEDVWIDPSCTFINCTHTSMPGAIDIEPNLAGSIVKDIRIGGHFKNIGGNAGVIGFNPPVSLTSPLKGLTVDKVTIRDSAVVPFLFYDTDDSVDADARAGIVVSNSKVFGCTNPFDIRGLRGIKFENVTWDGCTKTASIGYRYSCRDVEVNGCDFIECATTDYIAITLFNGSRVSIEGNDFDNCGLTDNTAGVPLKLAVGFTVGASDTVRFTRNHVRGSRTTDIVEKSASHTNTTGQNRYYGNIVPAALMPSYKGLGDAYPLSKLTLDAGASTATRLDFNDGGTLKWYFERQSAGAFRLVDSTATAYAAITANAGSTISIGRRLNFTASAANIDPVGGVAGGPSNICLDLSHTWNPGPTSAQYGSTFSPGLVRVKTSGSNVGQLPGTNGLRRKRAGTVASVGTAVTGTGTDFAAGDVGETFLTTVVTGNACTIHEGTVASVTNATSLTLNAALTNGDVSAGRSYAIGQDDSLYDNASPGTAVGAATFWNFFNGGHTHAGYGSYNINAYSGTITDVPGDATGYGELCGYSSHLTCDRQGALMVNEWANYINSGKQGRTAVLAMQVNDDNTYASYDDDAKFVAGSPWRTTGSRGLWIQSQGLSEAGTAIYISNTIPGNRFQRPLVYCDNTLTEVFCIDSFGNVGIRHPTNQSQTIPAALTIGYLQTGAASTVAEDGLNFGGDIQMFRFAADQLKLLDGLHINAVAANSSIAGASAGMFLSNAGRIDIGRNGTTLDVLRVYGTAGNANPTLTVLGSGTLAWGDGTSAYDVELFRITANVLKLRDGFTINAGTGAEDSNAGAIAGVYFSSAGRMDVGRNSLTQEVLRVYGAAGAANPTLQMLGDGDIAWGPGGGTAPDTTLSRTAVGELSINGTPIGSGSGFVTSVTDTNTIDHTVASGVLSSIIPTTATPQVTQLGIGTAATSTALTFVADTVPAGGISFGGDAGIYRSAANTLRLPGGDHLSVSGGTGVPAATTNPGAQGFQIMGTGEVLACRTAGTFLSQYNATGDAEPRFRISQVGGISWGPGGAAVVDNALSRVNSTTMSFSQGLNVNGDLGVVGGINVSATGGGGKLALKEQTTAATAAATYSTLYSDLSTVTQLRSRFGTNDRILMRDVAMQTYTQTYSTATRTHANPTATTITNGAGIAGFTTDAERAAVTAAINALIADVANVKQVVNAMVDDHQADGHFG